MTDEKKDQKEKGKEEKGESEKEKGEKKEPEYPKITRQQLDQHNRFFMRARAQNVGVEKSRQEQSDLMLRYAKENGMYITPSYHGRKLYRQDLLMLAQENLRNKNNPDYKPFDIDKRYIVELKDEQAEDIERAIFDGNMFVQEMNKIDIEYLEFKIKMEEEKEWHKFSNMDWEPDQKTLEMKPTEKVKKPSEAIEQRR